MPDRWLVITIRVPSAELTAELAEGLVALGGTAVEETEDRLTTYVPDPADPEPFLVQVRRRIEAITGAPPELEIRRQEEQDWIRRWREGLEPRRVGRRLVVTQPWHPVTADGDLVIDIDPGTAFGTGVHATTRGSLRLLEACMRGGERVLDVGSGSGILAIAAVRLGAAEVVAAEMDATALGNLRENLARNGVVPPVRLLHDVVGPEYLEGEMRAFDLIAANILTGVIVPLLPEFRDALRNGGRLIVGGIMETEADTVRAAAATHGLRVEAVDVEDGWWGALLRPVAEC